MPKRAQSAPRLYEVAGCQAVFDHQPGTKFLASLSEAQERYFLTGGHLALVDANPDPASDGESGDAAHASEPDVGETKHTRRRRKSQSPKEGS